MPSKKEKHNTLTLQWFHVAVVFIFQKVSPRELFANLIVSFSRLPISTDSPKPISRSCNKLVTQCKKSTIFRAHNFSRPKIFMPKNFPWIKFFMTKNFSCPKFSMTKIFLLTKISHDEDFYWPKFFMTKIFHGKNFLWSKFFHAQNFSIIREMQIMILIKFCVYKIWFA